VLAEITIRRLMHFHYGDIHDVLEADPVVEGVAEAHRTGILITARTFHLARLSLVTGIDPISEDRGPAFYIESVFLPDGGAEWLGKPIGIDSTENILQFVIV